MKKVIVFGGSGFLGSHVAGCLTKEGYEVTVYDIEESPYLKKGQIFIKGDIMDKGKVEEAIAGKDIVYNFAAIADIEEASDNPTETIAVNIMGTTNILEGCRKNKVERFVFASTVYVYSNLGTFYRSSKQSCELIIENYNKKYDLDFTVLRYGSLYGPRAGCKNSVHDFLKEALEKGKITRYGNGEEVREYIHVYDAAQLSVKILSEEFRNQYAILSGHHQIKVKDLLLMIKEMMGNNIRLEFVEADCEEHYDVTPYNFSPKLAKKISDFAHVDLGQGVLDLLNSMYADRNLRVKYNTRKKMNPVS